MKPVRIAVVGIGKIARDQHLPAIAADARLDLAATVSRHGGIDTVPNFASIDALIDSDVDVDAVSLCTPPEGRHALAVAAIDAGLHVMLEKPPATTLGDAEDLVARAREAGVALFATWHSRAAAAVAPARDWLAGRAVRSVRIDWLEDIRQWHPGQHWILAPGGFGVFDPGINALSILTAILPAPVRIDRSVLETPSNRGAPIAATLAGWCGDASLDMRLDFLKHGDQHWTIEVETDDGPVRLIDGGATGIIYGRPLDCPASPEYPQLYARFAECVARRSIDADLTPLRIVADAFLKAEHRVRESFDF